MRRISFAAGAPLATSSGEGKATNKRMNIKCSHCGTDYEVEEKDMYRYTKCEVCGKGFVIGATKSLQKVDGGGCEEEKQKKMPTLGIRRLPHQTSHQNIRYEELVVMNHVAYEQRKKKECQAALIKYYVCAVLLVVCCTGSSDVIEKRRRGVGKAPQIVSQQSSVDKKYAFDFFAARRGMGGSVLEALVRKLNESVTDDKMSHTSARTARATAMMSIAGAIGPIKYERQIRTTRTISTQAIGGFDGYAGGGVVSGTIYGPVSSIKVKVGGYVAKVPTGFRKAFDQMMRVARRGHSRANAEAGACIFVDAAKGQIGMDERKALALFTKAADLGDADGMYMQAFCLFYGIGKKDVHKAYRILLIWREQPASEILRNSGWARRRLDEAQQLGY